MSLEVEGKRCRTKIFAGEPIISGKLVGAGAGGFLLLYTSDPQRVRAAMSGVGLQEVPFRFDLDGSVVLARS